MPAEPDFVTVAVRVMSIGIAIAATGFTLLYLAFRSFALEKKNDERPVMLMLSLAAFVLVCCAALFAWSFFR
ncbi:MAG TPA: hypothetical protein VNL91_04775 [Thermoanaerobaculia bacterium]|nr:hypothetical protein [Thermoanaerobaculia bacterium]